jgi:hypothetical protein
MRSGWASALASAAVGARRTTGPGMIGSMEIILSIDYSKSMG